MDVTVSPSTLRGSARAPSSKSYTHRAILAAGLGNETTVTDPLLSADPKATIRAIEHFGGAITEDDGDLTVAGCDGSPSVPADVIDCANSGTTMRLVTATAGLVDGATVLTGDSSLRSRPQGPLLDALNSLSGNAFSTRGNGQAPLVVEGPISGGEVSIRGDVSSQYISALLMAGALTEEGITINLETELKSAPYVDITLEVLSAASIDAQPIDSSTASGASGFDIPGGQTFSFEDDTYSVPGDFSSISYLLAAGVIAGQDGLEIEGAVPSAQGDTAIVDIIESMGGDVTWEKDPGRLFVEQSSLTGVTVDVGDTPDLLPTLATLGAVAEGEMVIENCEHVRYKETDRVSAMATELERLGASVAESRDELIIKGSSTSLTGGEVEGYDDHRIIMALALVGLIASEPVTVRGADHVDVSFPGFFDVLYSLGARIQRQ